MYIYDIQYLLHKIIVNNRNLNIKQIHDKLKFEENIELPLPFIYKMVNTLECGGYIKRDDFNGSNLGIITWSALDTVFYG